MQKKKICLTFAYSFHAMRNNFQILQRYFTPPVYERY